jgi:hypothetical protein
VATPSSAIRRSSTSSRVGSTIVAVVCGSESGGQDPFSYSVGGMSDECLAERGAVEG